MRNAEAAVEYCKCMYYIFLFEQNLKFQLRTFVQFARVWASLFFVYNSYKRCFNIIYIYF